MPTEASNRTRKSFSDRTGSTAIEYALLAAVVAITAFAALTSLGLESDGLWQDTGDQLVNDGFKRN